MPLALSPLAQRLAASHCLLHYLLASMVLNQTTRVSLGLAVWFGISYPIDADLRQTPPNFETQGGHLTPT
jgi:hypothetical protein